MLSFGRMVCFFCSWFFPGREVSESVQPLSSQASYCYKLPPNVSLQEGAMRASQLLSWKERVLKSQKRTAFCLQLLCNLCYFTLFSFWRLCPQNSCLITLASPAESSPFGVSALAGEAGTSLCLLAGSDARQGGRRAPTRWVPLRTCFMSGSPKSQAITSSSSIFDHYQLS